MSCKEALNPTDRGWMHQVLLIEDAEDCQILVKESLAGCASVTFASTLSEAKERMAVDRFDMILLDLSLPDGDGLDFFSWLSTITKGAINQSEIPVVCLTAEAGANAQVMAFSLGADDYVVKPIRPVEFRARIEARLKKTVRKPQGVEPVLERGNLRIELESQRVYVIEGENRRDLELTGREFKLLYQLARSEGVVFSREQLIDAVWGGSVHVLDRTVDTHVYTLRKKMGDCSKYVESEVGLGYRFNSSIR